MKRYGFMFKINGIKKSILALLLVLMLLLTACSVDVEVDLNTDNGSMVEEKV